MEKVLKTGTATLTEKNFATTLPTHTRLWIYSADKFVSKDTADAINEKVNQFAEKWNYHKVDLSAAGALLYNCFLVLAVDEEVAGVGGCSLDASTRFIKEIGRTYNIDFMNRQLIYLLEKNEIKILTFSEAAEQFKAGKITQNSKVFNHAVKNKGEMQSQWICTLAETPYFSFIESPVEEFTFKL